MRLILATLATVALLVACGDTHHYNYPAPAPQEEQEAAPTPAPEPTPAPPEAAPPAAPTPPAGFEYRQFWFGTIAYQVAQSAGLCRVTVTAPTHTTTEISLHDCRPGTTARVGITTAIGSVEKTIFDGNPLLFTLFDDRIERANVFAMLRDGFAYPEGNAPMTRQGEIRWYKQLRATP